MTQSATDAETEQLAINTIRTLAIDAVEKADSGHPGAPMGLAPLTERLFRAHLRHDPNDPEWFDRDRFVLSAGHASMLLYAMLHLTGYDLSLDDIEHFRQLHSKTPGHPERNHTPGVDITTGPLGQGLGSSVGFALAERLLAARFNVGGHTLIDHRTWVIASDGDMMEGVQSEAASLAGHLGLDRLIVFYDDNSVTLDGPAAMSFTGEDVGKRYEAYGWRVLHVEDVNDLDAVEKAITTAAQGDGRPTLVVVKSVIGYGAPTKAGTSQAHGSPLGTDEAQATKDTLGWDYDEPFTVPERARDFMDCRGRGKELREEWEGRLAAYRDEQPELAADLERRLDATLPDGWEDLDLAFEVGESIATRGASGTVINALAKKIPELIGGSADLSSSTKTVIEDAGDVDRHAFAARNINYGVREHAMGAALNGMTAHGGLRPFGATFFNFTDYMRPSMRLAALQSLPCIYVCTHDSIGLGEDGPTHQPVEQLASFRAMPNMHVMRPADAVETIGAWRHALTRTEGPTLLVLSRQKLPVLERSDADRAAHDGVYAVVEADDPDVVLVATGSEVSLAVEAAAELGERDVTARVVSMPCWELAEELDADELEDLLPEEIPVLAVEAASGFGWDRWADDSVTMDSFGVSAPYEDAYAEFGFTPESVADAAEELIDEYGAEE